MIDSRKRPRSESELEDNSIDDLSLSEMVGYIQASQLLDLTLPYDQIRDRICNIILASNKPPSSAELFFILNNLRQEDRDKIQEIKKIKFSPPNPDNNNNNNTNNTNNTYINEDEDSFIKELPIIISSFQYAKKKGQRIPGKVYDAINRAIEIFQTTNSKDNFKKIYEIIKSHNDVYSHLLSRLHGGISKKSSSRDQKKGSQTELLAMITNALDIHVEFSILMQFMLGNPQIEKLKSAQRYTQEKIYNFIIRGIKEGNNLELLKAALHLLKYYNYNELYSLLEQLEKEQNDQSISNHQRQTLTQFKNYVKEKRDNLACTIEIGTRRLNANHNDLPLGSQQNFPSQQIPHASLPQYQVASSFGSRRVYPTSVVPNSMFNAQQNHSNHVSNNLSHVPSTSLSTLGEQNDLIKDILDVVCHTHIHLNTLNTMLKLLDNDHLHELRKHLIALYQFVDTSRDRIEYLMDIVNGLLFERTQKTTPTTVSNNNNNNNSQQSATSQVSESQSNSSLAVSTITNQDYEKVRKNILVLRLALTAEEFQKNWNPTINFLNYLRGVFLRPTDGCYRLELHTLEQILRQALELKVDPKIMSEIMHENNYLKENNAHNKFPSQKKFNEYFSEVKFGYNDANNLDYLCNTVAFFKDDERTLKEILCIFDERCVRTKDQNEASFFKQLSKRIHETYPSLIKQNYTLSGPGL